MSAEFDQIRNDLKTMAEQFDTKVAELRVQLKIMRLFSRIEDDLRVIRENLKTAKFVDKGEKGYIPPQVLEEGRSLRVPSEENEARSSAAGRVDQIEEWLDDFETDRWGSPDLDLSVSRCMSLESLQEEVRKEARMSRSGSLNQICYALSGIWDRVNAISESAKYQYLEKEAEDGLAVSQYKLGLAHCNGQGAPQDYEEAYFWLYLAAASKLELKIGGSEAVSKARDDAASHLTATELSRVQERARFRLADRPAELAQGKSASAGYGNA
jgi:TPR repeat protein